MLHKCYTNAASTLTHAGTAEMVEKRMYVRVYVCTYVCMYVCIYIHTFSAACARNWVCPDWARFPPPKVQCMVRGGVLILYFWPFDVEFVGPWATFRTVLAYKFSKVSAQVHLLHKVTRDLTFENLYV